MHHDTSNAHQYEQAGPAGAAQHGRKRLADGPAEKKETQAKRPCLQQRTESLLRLGNLVEGMPGAGQQAGSAPVLLCRLAAQMGSDPALQLDLSSQEGPLSQEGPAIHAPEVF